MSHRPLIACVKRVQAMAMYTLCHLLVAAKLLCATDLLPPLAHAYRMNVHRLRLTC